MADAIRFYLDQNVNPIIATGLRTRGIDVLTAHEAGRCGYDDPDQLDYAAASERVMFTFDCDYIILHNSGIPHAGIVWAPATKYPLGRLIYELTLVHGVYTADDMLNHLEYL